MTIIAVFLLIYIMYILIKYNKKECLIKLLLLYFIFSTFINMGYFVKISSIYIQYSQVLMVLLVVFLALTYRQKIANELIKNKKIIILIFMFFCFIIFNIAKLNFFSGNTLVMPDSIADINTSFMVNAKLSLDTIQKVINLFFFVVLCIQLALVMDSEVWQQVKSKYLNFGKLMILVCYFEILYNNFILDNKFRELLIFLFGRAPSQYTTIFFRKNIVTIQGLTKEPSMIASAFLFFGMCILLSNFSEIKKITYLILISIIMLFSGAFTGIATIGILLVIYLIICKSKIIKISVISLLAIAIGIVSVDIMGNSQSIMNYYFSRIGNLIDIMKYSKPALTSNDAIQKVQDIQYYFNFGGGGGSEYLRLSSILYNLDLFYQNIFLGVGLGSSNAHGAIPAILANIGLIGSILWVKILVYGKHFINLNKKIILLVLLCGFIFIGDISELFSGKTMMLIYLISYF